MIIELFSWWYGQGWAGVARGMQRRLDRTAHMYSVGLLLKTLFSPWRRVVTYPGASMQAHFQAFIDNLVSRCVGFGVRLMVLIAALFSLIGVFIACLIELLLWPLLPVAPIVFVILGLVA